MTFKSLSIVAACCMALASPLVAEGAPKDEVVLHFMGWLAEEEPRLRRVMDQFEARHPGVRVAFQPVPEGISYWAALVDLGARDALPDVMMMSSVFMHTVQFTLHMADINQLSPAFDAEALFTPVSSIGEVDGQRLAVPWFWNAPVLYYNVDLFEEAGVAPPDPDWSWREFLAAARALTRDRDGDGHVDQWGFMTSGRLAHLDPWIYRNGGRLLNDDRTRFEITDKALEAIAFLRDLVLVEGVAPKPEAMPAHRQPMAFAQGQSAMWLDGSWFISDMLKSMEMRWDIAEVPFGLDSDDAAASGYAWATLLSVTDDSQHPELAWELIRMIIAEAASPADFPRGRVPASREIALSREWYDLYETPANRGLFLEMVERPMVEGSSRNYLQWRGFGKDYPQGMRDPGGMAGLIDEVLSGGLALPVAVDQITALANEALQRAD